MPFERLKACGTAMLSDASDALGLPLRVLPARLQRFGSRASFAGPARTLRIELLGPGETKQARTPEQVRANLEHLESRIGEGTVVAIGIDAKSPPEIAVIGALLARFYELRKVAGVVTDAFVRDVDHLALPVIAGGASPIDGSRRVKRVLHAEPIEMAGIAVAENEIIVGDQDGVMVLPADAPFEAIFSWVADAKQREERVVEVVRETGRISEAHRRFGRI